jgi:hypothetical protein
MEDSRLIPVLNAIAARCIVLECQITALRRVLKTAGLVDDDKLEALISKCVDEHARALAQLTPEEVFASILRSFEGPVQ